jgi:hypothetical protein
VFLPIAVGVELPDALTRGTGEPDGRSAWWLMKALGDAVMSDPAGRAPAVQRVWHAWEQELLAEVAIDRAVTGQALADRVDRMLHRREALQQQMAAAQPAARGG